MIEDSVTSEICNMQAIVLRDCSQTGMTYS